MSAAEPAAQNASLLRAVAEAQRWITSIYRLDLDLRAEQFVVDPEAALQLLPPDSPRSGLVVVEEPAEISVGIYIDAADVDDPWTVIEETSHLLYLAWLADSDWSVSRLVLEFQSEVDRYAVARLKGRDGLASFESFAWCDWMDGPTRERYAAAHNRARSYCRSLERRYPARPDTPALLSELRHFYRAAPDQKLCAA
ncbi:MAG: hypothetical protein JRE43_01230 [Deltaproteobacteria bacterium]|jgi:hypothetical protein|nr:hypothetical protein [Deltaproteobacteria bacterium]